MSSQNEDTGGHVLATDTASYTATGNTSVVIGNIPRTAKVLKVEFIPSAAITANATNFSTLTLQNKGGLKTGTTAVASRSWAATNSVAATKELFALSGTPANIEVNAGDRLDLVQTSAAAGLALPTGTLLVTFLIR